MFRKLHLLMLPSAILVLAAVSIFLWISSSRLITPNRRGLEPRHRDLLAAPAEHGLALESFKVSGRDGVPLVAFFATRAPILGAAEKTRRMAERLGRSLDGPAPKTRGTVFILHGRSGMKEDMLAIAERFVAADYRCVVYDARCHGDSGGSACTFGHHETADFAAVLDESCSLLERRGEDPGQICAVGVSLGASVILQSLPTQPRLSAVVAVAPFAHLPEVVNHAAKRNIYSRIPLWLIAGTMRTSGMRAGFDPFQITPLSGVRASSTPVFFAHGALDELITVDHSERLHAAAMGRKILRIIPDGNHGNVLAKGGDALYEEMIRFCLSADPDSP